MALKKQAEKKKAGRPSEYNEKKYPQLAHNLCLLGATNEDLAKSFGVSVATIGEWIKRKTAFSDAIKAGREIADTQVANSLFQRAVGYSHKSQKMQLARDGTWKVLEFTEHYPPDPTSAIFWLKNRQPAKWREKLDIEQKVLTVKVEGEENAENEA